MFKLSTPIKGEESIFHSFRVGSKLLTINLFKGRANNLIYSALAYVLVINPYRMTEL